MKYTAGNPSHSPCTVPDCNAGGCLKAELFKDMLNWCIKVLGVIRIADEFLPYRTGAVENSMLVLILSRAQMDLNWQPVNDRETIIEMRIREPTRLCLNN